LPIVRGLKQYPSMFVRAKKKSENRWQVQIVESVKVDAKTRQRIIRNVGTAYNEKELIDFKVLGESIIIELKNKKNPVLNFADPADFHSPAKRSAEPVDLKSLREEKRLNQGFEKVMKPLFEELDVDLGNSDTNNIAASMVMARAFQPSSKLKTKKILEKHFDLDIPLHKIYRTIDILAEKQLNIKKAIAKKTFDLFDQNVDVMFFDVTTLYFESQSADELKEFGYSKDQKFKEVQVVLAMVTTTEGLPITYKLFPGNQFEGHTLIPIIEEMKGEFNIQKVFLAADRGMFNSKNLEEMDKRNIDYVVAAKIRSLDKATKASILQGEAQPTVVGNEFHWVKKLPYGTRDLVISYSSKRAKKDKADRQRLLDRLMKKVKDGKIKMADLINNHGSKKYIRTDGKSKASIDQEKIDKEAEWDGLYGVITNTNLTASEILERKHGLWQIEEAFRINKTTLKMRPIFHWTKKRIEGHICLCFITYAIVKGISFRLKKQKSQLSINNFLEALTDIQASVLVNKQSGKRYLMPSRLTTESEELLRVFKIKHKASILTLK